MTDLATVGFGVDTSGPKQLADSLDQTTKSAQSLNTTLDQTSAASSSASAGLSRLQSSTAATTASLAGTKAGLDANYDAMGRYLGPLTAIAGAAQRRTRGGFLHQGSIQLPNLSETFRDRFTSALSAKVEREEMPPQVLERAALLAAEKYGTDAWLRRC